jgi:hypothetical protein
MSYPDPDTAGWGTDLDHETDQMVEKFANEICEWITERFPGKDIGTSDDLVNNADETLHCRRIYIKTDLGCVIILPDFNKKSAAGIVVNLGLARAMSLEGFSDEYIDEHGKILSDPIPYKPSSVDVLGYYLSHKIDPKIRR